MIPISTAHEGKKVYHHSESLLQIILSPEKEDSYSAPFAKMQLSGNEKNNGFHIAGTDINGNDVLLQGFLGIKTAYIIAIGTTLIVFPFGLLFGILAGYFGKKTDAIITYVYSTFASIPDILLLVVLMKIFGNGLPQMCLALGITSWVGLCRIIRGETIKLKNTEFVQAAYALGEPHYKIMFRHILPNLMHIAIISSILRFSGLVMTEIVLSYLNIGVGPGTSSWGIMINQARNELVRDPVIWWNITTAFILVFGLILSVNYFGDILRDVLDPRSKKTQI
jgi:peptide/nickel transport system permease protein